ncbi:MAG: MFS transporter [Oscillospiraceae bacterium]|nr:MFS transporter [Oscillospiraceae bacterium]
MKKLIDQYSGLKRELYVLFVGKLVTAMGSFVWPMLTFFLTTRLGLSDGQSTMLLATAMILSLPAAILGGKLADRYSRKRIIIIFDCLTVSLYVLAAILPISYVTAGIIFMAGLFQTIEGPAYDALNADFSTSEQREKAYSLSYLGFNLGFIVGASLSGILFKEHIRLAFLLNGAAIFTSTLLIMLFVHMKNALRESGGGEACFSEYEKPVDDKLSVLTVLRRIPVVACVLLIGCFASMPSNVVGVLLPLQLKEELGAGGAALYGYLSSLNGLVVILFTPVFTVVLRRLTEIPKAVLGLLLFVGGITLFSLGNTAFVLFVGMFIFTLGEVVTVLGVNPYTSRRIPSSHRGRVGGVVSVVHSSFTAVTQYLISFILVATHSNYRLIWVIFITCGLVAAGLYAAAYLPDKRTFPLLYRRDGDDGSSVL